MKKNIVVVTGGAGFIGSNMIAFLIKKNHILDITGPRVIQKIISEKLNFQLKDGFFPGTIRNKTFLKNTNYEFQYMRQINRNVKSELYINLQKKFKKKACSEYEYI